MRMIRRSLLWFILSGLGLSACSMDREALRPTGKTPGQPLLDKLYGAIRNDTGLDFLLGQGVVPFFFRSVNLDDLTLHIDDMRCRSSRQGQLCAFDLVRDSDPKSATDMNAPKMLRCTASFRHDDEEGWTVVRRRPKGASHSRSTLQCEIAES